MVVKNRGPAYRMPVRSVGRPLTVTGCRPAGSDERGMRQRHFAHARNLAQASLQVGIEGGDPRLRIAGLRGIQLEEQHVVAIEPQGDRVEIRERPHEEARRDQQQQRDRDLRDDEDLRQAQAWDLRVSRAPGAVTDRSLSIGINAGRVE